MLLAKIHKPLLNGETRLLDRSGSASTNIMH